MPPGPPKILEDLAKILIPPACREEVLGDLYERYKSPLQYLGDLLSTLPFVILSRVRRVTDIRLVLIDALLVYGSFLASAWFLARKLVTGEGGLVRLAIPSGLALVYLLVLCGVLGLLTDANYYGFILSFLLVGTAKPMFEPGTGQPQGAGGPQLRTGQASRPVSRAEKVKTTLLFLTVFGFILWNFASRRGVSP